MDANQAAGRAKLWGGCGVSPQGGAACAESSLALRAMCSGALVRMNEATVRMEWGGW